MALINKKELKSTNMEELKKKLIELEKELMKHNAQIAIGTVPKSPGLVRETKKTISRIKNLLRNKNLYKEAQKKHD